MHERDLRTDQPGTTKDRAGYAKHGIEPRTNPKDHEATVFARRLAETIERARAKSQVERVLLVAPPEFLGHLRAALDANARKIVHGEFNLNVVRMAPDEIRRRLPERLYSASRSSAARAACTARGTTWFRRSGPPRRRGPAGCSRGR